MQEGTLEFQVACRHRDCNHLVITSSGWELGKAAYFQTVWNLPMALGMQTFIRVLISKLSGGRHSTSSLVHFCPSPFSSLCNLSTPQAEKAGAMTGGLCTTSGTWTGLSRTEEVRNNSWEFIVKLLPMQQFYSLLFQELTLSNKWYVCYVYRCPFWEEQPLKKKNHRKFQVLFPWGLSWLLLQNIFWEALDFESVRVLHRIRTNGRQIHGWMDRW